MRIMAALIAAALATGCGGGDGEGADPPPAGPATRAVELRLRVDDGRGGVREAALTCTAGETEAGGYLSGSEPEALCDAAAALGELLTEDPSGDRVCTQVYGGPESARVGGTLAGRPVDRRFDRENGCRIAEWDRLARAGLLPGP